MNLTSRLSGALARPSADVRLTCFSGGGFHTPLQLAGSVLTTAASRAQAWRTRPYTSRFTSSDCFSKSGARLPIPTNHNHSRCLRELESERKKS